MKTLIALLVLLVCAYPQTVRAQAADSWVSVSPPDERFAIQMPAGQVVISQNYSFDRFKVTGHSYASTVDEVDYSVWSLVNENPANSDPPGNDAYLDACADLVWESLLKPLRDQVPKSPLLISRMSYQGELGKLAPGREYAITLGDSPGLARIYVAGQQIYVLTILNAEANSAGIKRFLNSFGLKPPGKSEAVTAEEDATHSLPSGRVFTATGVVGPGRGGNPGGNNANVGGGEPATKAGGGTDSNQIFKGSEVNQKTRVLSKPEPQYTESARKYSVTGTVVLRAVFSSSGEVKSLSVVSRLPHGLTERALEAARQIRFVPAVKDGQAVSMYIQLEYNFNLY